MAYGAALGQTITRLTRLIRQRRALFYGVRGLCGGCASRSCRLPCGRCWGPGRPPSRWAWRRAGRSLGVLYGLLLRVPPADALGLADRAFDLKDRLATAHDLLARPDRGTLAEAAIGDAEAHTREIRLQRAVPWRWPRELKLLPAPVLVLAALPYLPPDPDPRRLHAELHSGDGGGEEAGGGRAHAGHRAAHAEEGGARGARGDAGPGLPDAPQPGEPRACQGRPGRRVQGHERRDEAPGLLQLPEAGRRPHPAPREASTACRTSSGTSRRASTR